MDETPASREQAPVQRDAATGSRAERHEFGSRRLRVAVTAFAALIALSAGWFYPGQWQLTQLVSLALLTLLACAGGAVVFMCAQMLVDEPASEILNVLSGQQLAIRDRARFINRLQHECDAAAARRRARSFSVLVIMLSDVQSEPERVERVMHLRDAVRHMVRGRDILGDVGKDELWILALGAGALSAEALSMRLTEGLRASDAAYRAAPPSIGWSTFDIDGVTAPALLDAARERALAEPDDAIDAA
jgi:hypothetical protein